jgi:hypothetical protein
MTLKSNWSVVMNSTNPRKDKHIHILLKRAKSALNRSKQYAFVMYITATLYVVSPFVGMQSNSLHVRKYPFFGWYYIDRSSNLIYWICFLAQVHKAFCFLLFAFCFLLSSTVNQRAH